MSSSKKEQIAHIMTLFEQGTDRMYSNGLLTPEVLIKVLDLYSDHELTTFTAAFNTFLQARAEEKASSK